MTEETTSTALATFDIRDDLADRNLPEDSVIVYFNEVLAYENGKIEKELQRLSAKGDTDAYSALEEKFVAAKRELKAQGYVVHLRAVTRRQREDIQSKALAKFPFKRDAFNRDDAAQENNRRKALRQAIFNAYITKLVAPSGAVQLIEGDDGEAVVDMILAQAPEDAITKIDLAIGALTSKLDYDVDALDVDFLS